MSRLKELRLHGFKSFADPTRFVFEPGVNAVIGPNGSGKSNMADAVRWVLGEQSNRSLRTRRSDDVIFAGSDGRRAQGMAEAILTLDNGDGWLPIEFAEVAVGRRAYRSGESEYLINGTRARLRDVVELLGEGRLGANELVVVGQGTIDAALSLRPEERRQLFEEAAGVKNLQVRRNEASSRLAKARDNLTRVADVVGELKPQARRLALQAQHQQQHETLGRRAAALVTEAHRRRESDARSALGEARRLAAAAEAALEAHRGEQSAARSAAAAAEERYWQAEAAAREAGAAREATREALVRAEARHEGAMARLEDARRRLAVGRDELAATERDLTRHSGGAPHDDVAPAIAAAAAAEDRWREAVGSLAAADAAMLAAEDALAAARHRHSERIAADARRSEEAAREAARREAASADRAGAIERLEGARAAQGAAREQARRAAAGVDDASRALEAAAARRDRAQAAADETRTRAVEIGERLAAARAELAALVDRQEGAGLSTVLSEHGWASLLDELNAPEDAWPAIEALVGGELEQALLWRDADLVPRLAEARGSVRLLAPETRRDRGARDRALRAVGATRTMADWVGSDRAPALLHHAAVAPDLEALLRGWQGLPEGWCAVTPAGDLGDARGVLLLRGRGDPPGGVAARAHARRRELTEIVGRLESEHRDSTAASHVAAEELRQARDAHIAARDRHDAADRAARSAQGELQAADEAGARLADEVHRLGDEVSEWADDADATGRATAGTALDLGPLERSAADARASRDAAAAARDTARATWNATRGAAEEAERRSAGQRQGATLLAARAAQLRAELPVLADAIGAIEAELRTALRAVDDARGADGDVAARRAQAEEAREARRGELLELERGNGVAGGELAELERAAQTTAVEVSRREEALAALGRERELSLESLPLGSGVSGDEPADVELAAALAALDAPALEAELGRVRRTLAQIGSVNPFAVEEHRELATRLEDLMTQEEDLAVAIASTEELIARLDGEITAKFDDAFRAIGERFDEYCRLLFDGGSASLQLADEGDGEAPGGIEIVVRPPGKRLQRLAMLSGGERALTGVALLFAMLTVNPVPFCILDEVDAALDEANIGRFAAALRRLSESIDFVVITHNRATIEIADTIYGVTMTDAAVSRVLSLRLADVPIEATA